MITARLVDEDGTCTTLQVPVVNAPKVIVWNGRFFRLTGSSYGMVVVYDETSAWLNDQQMLVLPGMVAKTPAAQYKPDGPR